MNEVWITCGDVAGRSFRHSTSNATQIGGIVTSEGAPANPDKGMNSIEWECYAPRERWPKRLFWRLRGQARTNLSPPQCPENSSALPIETRSSIGCTEPQDRSRAASETGHIGIGKQIWQKTLFIGALPLRILSFIKILTGNLQTKTCESSTEARDQGRPWTAGPDSGCARQPPSQAAWDTGSDQHLSDGTEI